MSLLFTDEERLVFSYHVRGEKRWADPLEVRRRMIRAGLGELDRILDDAEEPAEGEADTPGSVQVRCTAQERRHEILCEAFRLERFDPATGKGITEVESLTLLRQFEEWLEKNANWGGPTPAPSPPSDSPPAA